MFITPLALELARLCLVSLGGEEERPPTAESTLERGSDMMMVVVILECLADAGFGCEQRGTRERRRVRHTSNRGRGIGVPL